MPTRRSKIVSDPAILGGKPIVEGTRLSVEFILQLFEADMTPREILDSYPHLTSADLHAVLAYARRSVQKKLRPIPKTGERVAV